MAQRMAQRTAAQRTPAQKTVEEPAQAAEADKDSPLLDLSDQAVKKLLKTAKEFIAGMFQIEPAKVRLFHYDPAYAIKASVPRWGIW